MTEQERFWSGEFGDDYTARNTGEKIVEANIDFFSKALVKAKSLNTLLELGCNNGMNLLALEYLYPDSLKTGIDINAESLVDLAIQFCDRGFGPPDTYLSNILDFDYIIRGDDPEFSPTYELVFTKGVLIHCNPNDLHKIYDKIYNLSSRYILFAEYYSPEMQMIKYRGYDNVLFKRDFASEILSKYPLKLIDYGFVYHLDEYPQDDLNWFLMEKK